MPSATNVPRANFQVQEKEKRGRAAEYDEFNFLLTAFEKSASMIGTFKNRKESYLIYIYTHTQTKEDCKINLLRRGHWWKHAIHKSMKCAI